MKELLPHVYQATMNLKLGPAKLLTAMYVIKSEDAVILIDPFELQGAEAQELDKIGKPTVILIDGITHARDSNSYRKRYDARVLSHHEAAPKLEIAVDDTFGDGETLPGGLITIGVPGTRPGETIFLRKHGDGTLIVGDALLNLRPSERGLIMRLFGFPEGLGTMPKLLIKDKKVAAESYRKLLDYDFDQILVSHGHAILSGAKDMLRASLEK